MTRLIAIILTILCASVFSITAYPLWGRHMPPSDPDDMYEVVTYALSKKTQETIPKSPSSQPPKVSTSFSMKLVNNFPLMKPSRETPATEIMPPRPMYNAPHGTPFES